MLNLVYAIFPSLSIGFSKKSFTKAPASLCVLFGIKARGGKGFPFTQLSHNFQYDLLKYMLENPEMTYANILAFEIEFTDAHIFHCLTAFLYPDPDRLFYLPGTTLVIFIKVYHRYSAIKLTTCEFRCYPIENCVKVG